MQFANATYYGRLLLAFPIALVEIIPADVTIDAEMDDKSVSVVKRVA